MSAQPKLTAVTGGRSRARTPRKKDVATAAATGDQLQLLLSMRERIAGAVADPECHPRDLAALTRRLQEIAREIHALETRADEEAPKRGRKAADEAVNVSAL